MRKLERPLVCMLAIVSLGYVSTGVALALHLSAHQTEASCPDDSHHHESSGHDHPKKDDHDSRRCSTCWQLSVIAKRILAESPNLIPDSIVLEFVLFGTTNQHVSLDIIPSLQPRAPPPDSTLLHIS